MRKKDNSKLKKVHIFDEVWCIGKPNKKEDHAVIYGPDDKEYHLDRKSVRYLLTHEDGFWSDGECMTNRWNLGRVKAYILSHIIDPGNWVYDLSTPPEVGTNIKVIYENGTIKWIESFTGDFKDHEFTYIESVPMRTNPKWINQRTKVKNDNEPIESQFIWEDRERTKKVLAWRPKTK